MRVLVWQIQGEHEQMDERNREKTKTNRMFTTTNGMKKPLIYLVRLASIPLKGTGDAGSLNVID